MNKSKQILIVGKCDNFVDEIIKHKYEQSYDVEHIFYEKNINEMYEANRIITHNKNKIYCSIINSLDNNSKNLYVHHLKSDHEILRDVIYFGKTLNIANIIVIEKILSNGHEIHFYNSLDTIIFLNISPNEIHLIKECFGKYINFKSIMAELENLLGYYVIIENDMNLRTINILTYDVPDKINISCDKILSNENVTTLCV